MNNILTSPLPTCVTIDGCDYAVHTAFQVWIEAGRLIERIADLAAGGETAKMLAGDIARLLMLCYIRLPPTMDKAIDALAAFYVGGGFSAEPRRGSGSAARKPPLFCFEQDAPYIYAAFMTQYGIDLQAAELHWWQFRALFCALCDCRFTKIMEYRSIDISEVEDDAQKRFYRKMKRLYRLEDRRTAVQKDGAFAELFTM